MLLREKGLLGQDQLVFAGDAQQVALACVFDFDGVGTLQNLLAIHARQGVAGWRNGFRRGVHVFCCVTMMLIILTKQERLSITFALMFDCARLAVHRVIWGFFFG